MKRLFFYTSGFCGHLPINLFRILPRRASGPVLLEFYHAPSPSSPLPLVPLPLFPSSPLRVFPSQRLPLFPSLRFPSSSLPLSPSSPLTLRVKRGRGSSIWGSNVKHHLSLPESGGLRLLLNVGLVALVLALGSVSPSSRVAFRAAACISTHTLMQNLFARPCQNGRSRSLMRRVGTQAQLTGPLKQKNLVTEASKSCPSVGQACPSVGQACVKH